MSQGRSQHSIGEELQLLRQSRGLRQIDGARLIGCCPKTVSRWERGQYLPHRIVLERYMQLLGGEPTVSSNRKSPAFTFIDLFAGIGGMRFAFESAGGACAFTSEWDNYSKATYTANFPGSHVHGDITTIPMQSIPPHDVLAAGFPCQPFSLAGVSKKNSLERAHGFACEAQGTLFFNLAEILDHHRPQAFLLENVKNLKSHDKGRTFGVIKGILEGELKYKTFPLVVDARSVLPQHRERIFIVGFKDPDTRFDWSKVRIPKTSPTLASILHPEDGSEPPHPRFIDTHGRVLPKYTLSDHLWQYLQDYAQKHREKGNGFGYGLFGPADVARTLSARYHKDGSEILIKRGRGTPRRLTPLECSRLMGYDKKWLGRAFRIPDAVSDTQLYRQFGNSVAVPVVQAIAKEMKKFITREHELPSNVLELPLGMPRSA